MVSCRISVGIVIISIIITFFHNFESQSQPQLLLVVVDPGWLLGEQLVVQRGRHGQSIHFTRPSLARCRPSRISGDAIGPSRIQ